MPSSISGTIFNDINQDGAYVATDPGIAGVYVQLLLPNNTCITTQSTSTGTYTFSNLTIAGTYQVFETVALPDSCPATTFTQPTSFNTSTTPRMVTQAITQVQINANTNFPNLNFGHASITDFPCLSEAVVIPARGLSTSLTYVDVLTGAYTTPVTITPNGFFNAIGYSTLDSQIYGYDAGTSEVIRLSQNGVATLFASIPNLPAIYYDTGAIDQAGHLYLYEINEPRFYVVDVNPNSATYLYLVDPAAGFTLQTANYGVPISTPVLLKDWAFNPLDGFLYGAINAGSVIRINPVTGVITSLITTGLPSLSAIDGYSGAFFDTAGNLYLFESDEGHIYRVQLSPYNAIATLFSTTITSSNSDATRCNLAVLNLLSATKQVNTVAATLGSIVYYAITITNLSQIAVDQIVLTDTVPEGTTFVPNSVTIGGAPSTDSPNTGISVGTLGPNASIDVAFQVQIGDTLPTINPIENTSTVAYYSGVPLTSNSVSTLILNSTRGITFLE